MTGGSRSRFRSDNTQHNIIAVVPNKTDEKFASTEVADFFQEELKEINAHDYEAINRHKQTIADKLKSECDVENIRFGGSHSTHTDVQGLSDIDMLADLGDFKGSQPSDQTIKDFTNAIKERLPNTKVSSGVMAVTVEFSDGLQVQILPAFRHRDGYQISDPNGKGWIQTFPKRFARELTSVNQKLSGQVVPTIKLIKSICDANNVGVSSYHVSNMALNVFKHYAGPKTHQKMLQHFFNNAKSLCLKPTVDPSGQTQYVDGDLSSSKRKRMAGDFAQIENKIKKAIESPSLTKWKDLFKK
ncbi:MAG: CBASS oligonucleotide cyclase [Candidatus Poribacteria bacterium]|nr:CBASS oligonucleotide cyclase [Candidatus Poribacteria bacterium]